MQSNIKYCMQLVHNDALLDSSIYGLARPIKHYIVDLLHILVHVRTLFVQFRTISTKTIQKKFQIKIFRYEYKAKETTRT
jgi:hypothetical protein